MNEDSRTPGKRTSKGVRCTAVWLVLLTAIFLSLLVVVQFLPGRPDTLSDWVQIGLVLFVVSFAIATVLLGVWQFGRWVCCRSNLRRGLLSCAAILAMIALFYAEEDWRGWHTWRRFRKEWEAKGEHFALASVVPRPVPDELNFALTPIALTSYGQVLTRDGKAIPAEKRDGHFEVRMRMPVTPDYPVPTNCAGDWTKGTFIRLEGWQSHYRELAGRTNQFPVPAHPGSPAADVLLALSRYDAAIEELRAASRLPCSRFPVNYEGEPPWRILLPHLACLKSCAQVLRLRSVAELQNGQPDQALQDVRLALHLTDKVHTEPLLISHLVRIAMGQLTLQPVWEGLAEHKWSVPQLAVLEAELAKLDFLADWRLGTHGELGGLADSMELLRRHPERLCELEDLRDFNGNQLGPWLPHGFAARFIPSGWFYQNLYHCARLTEDYYLPMADTSRGTFTPDSARRAEAASAVETPGPYNLFERFMLGGLGQAAKRFAYGQASVDLARTAIAIERWRLGHGALPESLDALAPQCIAKVPCDVIVGQPLKYRREAGDRFVLYSVGWNQTDDGGVASLKADGTVELDRGDWVWRYPPKAN
ncbi:MAG: hypothetical protein ACLQM8_02330 [Limisphaerales bacterium]